MSTVLAEERLSRLRTKLREEGSVTLASAADSLGVSQMTVRRDLDALEAEGSARRVRGGAVYTGPVSVRGRDAMNTEAKTRIAEKLLPRVPRSGLIAIDSSTTMYRLAMLIDHADDLTVVTNSYRTMKALASRPGVTASLTGGTFDERSDSLIGPMATASVDRLNFSAFFASCTAFDPSSGCYDHTMEEAQFKQSVARNADQVVVGADASKWGERSVAVSLPLNEVDHVCTEKSPGAIGISISPGFPALL
jgi:DeoR/GlpR family transcriptional regulator of sugar metabolism